MKKITKRAVSILCAMVMVLSCLFTVPSTSASDVQAAALTPVAEHGQLRVSGTDIVDQYGQKFQLRGISTHGINWDVGYPYVNKAAFQDLRDGWGVNAIRLALYTHEYNGYCAGGNQGELKKTLYNGVQYATDLGMYAIIDWHVLNDQNPLKYVNQSKTFFEEVSKKYSSYNNIIYEICNEPNNCSWQDIKSYANQIIPIIRKNDPDAIIIVGTPTWSQLGNQGHTYEVADSPLTGYSNIMYALHFYAAEQSHTQYLRTKLQNTVDRGIPVIVSEFGLSEASGNGRIDTASGTAWLDLMDKNNVSYFCWSLSNKNESASLISPSCNKKSGWSDSDLSDAGRFIKQQYLARTQDTKINNPDVPMAPGITLSYATHVQSIGWQAPVTNGRMSGTTNMGKRLESIKINVSGANLGIRYRTHVQTYGWQNWVSDGAESGTTGQAKRLEAIMIELTGPDKDKYDIYYRVHAQSYGWLDWAKNGAEAGTEGYAKRLEAINIFIVPKGQSVNVNTGRSFVTPYGGGINYCTHVQSYGWQGFVADGATSGTQGQAKRLEAIKIKLNRNMDGGVEYTTHVQTYGWSLGWRRDGDMSGTQGQAKRLEAIRIRLTGNAATQYDVYYRVHVQSYGWLDWAKNGDMAGTSGMAKRLEGIEIRLVPKDGPAPGSTARSYIIQ